MCLPHASPEFPLSLGSGDSSLPRDPSGKQTFGRNNQDHEGLSEMLPWIADHLLTSYLYQNDIQLEQVAFYVSNIHVWAKSSEMGTGH